MELSNEDGFLEELLGLGRETWGETNPTAEISTLFSSSCWGSSCLNNNYFQDSTTSIQLIPPAGTILPPNTSTAAYHQDLSIDSMKPSLDEYSSTFNDEIYSALEAKFMAAAAAAAPAGGGGAAGMMLASAADDSTHMRNSSSNHQLETSSPPFPPMNLQEEYSLSSIMEDDEPAAAAAAAGMQLQGDKNNSTTTTTTTTTHTTTTTTNNNNYIEEMPLSSQQGTTCKVEPSCATQCTEFNMGLMCMEYNNNNKNSSSSRVMKKLESTRQPSKNLMAERRRRKRLNDRLSMLRSVVPKISKMDRTSILGDTIDYMKELLEKINNLQEEIDVSSSPTRRDELNVVGIFKDLMKPNDVLVRNSPKFDVERRNMDTRVEICCAAKPGLLLSTISALEQLGLEIQQCVISCFNDFSLQASCSEEAEQRALISSEEVKQALFRNAGYGGRCL